MSGVPRAPEASSCMSLSRFQVPPPHVAQPHLRPSALTSSLLKAGPPCVLPAEGRAALCPVLPMGGARLSEAVKVSLIDSLPLPLLLFAARLSVAAQAPAAPFVLSGPQRAFPASIGSSASIVSWAAGRAGHCGETWPRPRSGDSVVSYVGLGGSGIELQGRFLSALGFGVSPWPLFSVPLTLWG